jgi:hypothetical protein
MNMEHVYLRENIEACEAQIAASEAVLGAMARCLQESDDPYGPVHIDIERMERALAGPRWTLPQGLSHEQIIQYMHDCAAGKIAPDAEQFEVTRGCEIQPVHETSPDTPQGMMKVATDGERNGRLAWVPGIRP